MNTDSLFAIFDAVMFGAGIYCLYSWYMMKFKGVIHENRMTIPSDQDIGSCVNPAAYMQYMGPRILMFSILSIIFGGINLLSHAMPIPTELQFICLAVLFAVIVWFAFVIRKSVQAFWPQQLK